MIPDKLRERLVKLGIDENIYETRSRKCLLSREPLKLEQVPWYEHAYYIPDGFDRKEGERSTFGTSNCPFIFDPVSLVPCLALEPEKKDSILDMCAAPGTKTFIVSFLTENEARITANDISYSRLKRLKFNAEKFGLSVEIINKSGRKLKGSYDKILLDAPCSGEGMVNKNEKVFSHWSERRIKIFSKKQKKLISHAFELLTPKGTLLYSTCTFGPEENEGVVDFLMEKLPDAGIEKINVSINNDTGMKSWGDAVFDERLSRCLRIYPHHNNTGGFFVAKIRKL